MPLFSSVFVANSSVSNFLGGLNVETCQHLIAKVADVTRSAVSFQSNHEWPCMLFGPLLLCHRAGFFFPAPACHNIRLSKSSYPLTNLSERFDCVFRRRVLELQV